MVGFLIGYVEDRLRTKIDAILVISIVVGIIYGLLAFFGVLTLTSLFGASGLPIATGLFGFVYGIIEVWLGVFVSRIVQYIIKSA